MKSKEGEEEENKLLNLRNKKKKCTAQAVSCECLRRCNRDISSTCGSQGSHGYSKHDTLRT